MRIEFLGVSGSGKTFIAEKLYPELKNKYPDIIWPYKRLYQNHSHAIRNIIKLFYVTIYSILHFTWFLKLGAVISNSIHGTSSQRFILFFNGIYLKFEMERNKNVTTIFDEGVAQYIWALCLRNKRMLSIEEFRSIIQLFGCPEVVHVIYASPKTIAKRIKERGRRVYIQRTENIESDIKFMQDIQRQIVECFSDCYQKIQINIVKND